MIFIIGAAQVESASWLQFLSNVIGSAAGFFAACAWPAAIVVIASMFQRDLRGLIPKLLSLKAGLVEARFSAGVESMPPLPAAEGTESLDLFVDPPKTAPAPAESAPADEGTRVEPQGPYAASPGTPTKVQRDRPTTSDSTYWQTKSHLHLEDHLKRGRSSVAAAHLSNLMPNAMPQSIFNLVEAAAVADVSPSSAVVLAWRAVELELEALKQRLDIHDLGSVRLISNLSAKGALPGSMRTRFAELKDLRNTVVHASQFAGSLPDVLQYIERSQEVVAALSNVRALP